MTTATAKTTPQINALIGWTSKNCRAARAARFMVKISTYSVKRPREILIFEVLSTSRARSSKFFILCLCMKIIPAKQAKSVLCLFCTTRPTCNNSKTLNLAQTSILIWRFHCSSRRRFLISLILSRKEDGKYTIALFIRIGHFQVHFILYFKARLRARSLFWRSVFIYIEIRNNCHNKNFELRLALKESLMGTRKRPIVLSRGLKNFAIWKACKYGNMQSTTEFKNLKEKDN